VCVLLLSYCHIRAHITHLSSQLLLRVFSLHIWYRSVPNIYIRPPFVYKPPRYIFNRSSCTGSFISQIGPPNHGHATKIATWPFTFKVSAVECMTTLERSQRPQTMDNIVRTDQLRNSPTITSMSASGVNAIAHWKDKPAECLENATIYAVATGRGGVFAR